MTLPIADTSFVEATWILVVKSIVIFAVIFVLLLVVGAIGYRAVAGPGDTV